MSIIVAQYIYIYTYLSIYLYIYIYLQYMYIYIYLYVLTASFQRGFGKTISIPARCTFLCWGRWKWTTRCTGDPEHGMAQGTCWPLIKHMDQHRAGNTIMFRLCIHQPIELLSFCRSGMVDDDQFQMLHPHMYIYIYIHKSYYIIYIYTHGTCLPTCTLKMIHMSVFFPMEHLGIMVDDDKLL